MLIIVRRRSRFLLRAHSTSTVADNSQQVSDIVSLRERGRYQGILEVVIAISNGIGPVLGGVISEKASWRYIFYLNLPLCAISIIVIARFLPLKRVGGGAMEKLVKIDYLGSALTILGWSLIFPKWPEAELMR